MDKFNQFISSITPKKKATTSPFYPTPTGNSPKVTGVLAPQKPTASPVTSNAGATNPVIPKVTSPRSTLPPAGQQYVNNLSAPEKRDANGLLINPADAKFDRNTGKPIGGITAPNTPTPTTPTSSPTAPQSPYAKYLNSLFDPDQLKSTQDASAQANLRLAGIQSRNEKQALDGRVNYENALDKSGGLLSGARQSANMINRRASAESAYGAIEEGAAARTAGVYQNNFDSMLGAGKSLYEIEQDELKRNEPIEVGGVLYQKQGDGTYKPLTPTEQDSAEGFTLGEGQTRYDAQGNIIAQGGSSSPLTGPYEAGTNPTIDAYVKGIQSGTYKVSDVPDEYQDAVAQAMSQASNQPSESSKEVISIIDTLLANPKLDRIFGPVDQFLGGMLGEAAVAKNYFNQLKGVLSLENRQKLKGQGAISDFEFKVLGQAATALGRNLGNEFARAELQKLKDKLSGNAPIPTTPTEGDVWKAPDGVEYEFKKGLWSPMGNFNKVGGDTNRATSLEDAKARIARNESEGSGGYQALGPVVTSGQYQGERALGKYQVMPGNLAEWSKEAVGRSVTTTEFMNNPQLQEAIVSDRLTKIFKRYGNWSDVASVWFTGQPLAKGGNKKDVLGTTGRDYVRNFNA